MLPFALSLWAFYSGFAGGYLVRTRDFPIRSDVARVLAAIGLSTFILLTITSFSDLYGAILHSHIETEHDVVIDIDCLVFWASVAGGYVVARLLPGTAHGRGPQTS